MAAASLFVLSACEKKDNGTETTQKKIMNGTVESAADFTRIGVYIDVNKNDSGVTDVKYTISGEIAIVSFRYKGVRVELRGSCKYSQYELAGVKDTSNGDLIATDINGYRASLYTLDPGRIIFWSDGKINYSLYIYVTATDDDVNEIVKQISFESRYEERDDVKNQTVDEGKQFAEKIIKVFCDKDIEALEDMMYYPQFAEKYLKQGTKIAVTGRIQTGSYTNKDGNKVYTTDVVIEEQEFAESKAASGQTSGGGYQPADYNESTGSYEIGNGGQMFWFAALVNGDGEHTQIQKAKPDAHGVLVSDISLKNPADENYEWKPIGEFKGIFDGQNHTISDFSMTKVNDQSIGFFQNLMSDPNETDEAKKATLKNFTLNGTIVTTAEAASAVGGVVGTTSDSVIRRVNSNVNIGSGLIYYIGGIVGEINAATSIEESTYSGKIVLDYSFYGVGGIVGFVTDDDTYAGGTKIKDCANYGLITYYKVENHGGRGYSGGITGQVALGEEDFILSDCYNYGSVLAEEWKEIYGAISGYCAAKKDGIKNNYYLDTLPVKGFLGEAEIANDEELAKAKTAEQFKSGEEAYLLNNEVTDGSQVWYQNIDNGETPDAYPVLDLSLIHI